MKKLFFAVLLLIVISLVGAYLYLQSANSYQLDGQVSLSVLDAPVTIHRDQNGIPYIFASSTADAIRAQGFVVGQDRVFQVELYRALIEGRLASIIGEDGLRSDIQMRVLGLTNNAERHYSQLDQGSRDFLQWYAEGYNEFIQTRKHEFPFELSLLGLTPSPVRPQDLLAVQHYAGFVQARNYEDEILILKLSNELGEEKARELLPLNVNPDRGTPTPKEEDKLEEPLELVALQSIKPDVGIFGGLPLSEPNMGSNNWVGGSSKSVNGTPILSNDPHLDASILPGPWYPVGLFTPSIRAVGANLPGVPGIIVGRNANIAFGVTNAYGDSQDLYLEVDRDTVFQSEIQQILIKNDSSETGYHTHELEIRHTSRGPVISDHEAFGMMSQTPITLRTAAAEMQSPSIGIHKLLNAKTIEEADAAIDDIDVFYFNYVFADQAGGIAYRATGAIPIRENGATAKPASTVDDWQGFIPKAAMPAFKNPKRDWLGTSNHDVIPENYPYFYSTHFSPNYRYLRTKEWFESNQPKSAEAHWSLIKDVKNKHAERFVPVFLDALQGQQDFADFVDLLSTWNFEDTVDSNAATVFHLMHEYLIRTTFEQHMSEAVFGEFLQSRYFWLQRVDELMVEQPTSYWFDLKSTQQTEQLDDLIVIAAQKTREKLEADLGSEISDWNWGRYHQVQFVSPLKQSGTGANWLGGGTHAVNGSGETLNRGQYSLNEGPYRSQWFSSMRMVADLSDSQKIMASISGGNAARQFHPYFTSQLDGWLKEEWSTWWFDKSLIEANSTHQLTLNPN